MLSKDALDDDLAHDDTDSGSEVADEIERARSNADVFRGDKSLHANYKSLHIGSNSCRENNLKDDNAGPVTGWAESDHETKGQSKNRDAYSDDPEILSGLLDENSHANARYCK